MALPQTGTLRHLTADDLGRLSLLAAITKTLSSASGSPREVLGPVLDTLLAALGAERIAAMLYAPDGTREDLIHRGTGEEFRYSSTVIEKVRSTGEPVLSVDALVDAQFAASHSMHKIGARSVMCVPLAGQKRNFGLLYVDNRLNAGLFQKPELDLLTILADLLASSLERAEYRDDLEKAMQDLVSSREETITRLAAAADWRDLETAEHIERVGHYSAALASWAGFDTEFVDSILLASKMHDVGKLGVPDAILRKPGKFTPEEFEQMKLHTTMGARILEGSRSPLIQMAERIALSHHERYDGAGYPNGLRGEDIPVEGRIVAICDAFDAMTSKRVYKPAFPAEQAFTIIREELGRQLDPILGSLFLEHQRQVLAIMHRFQD